MLRHNGQSDTWRCYELCRQWLKPKRIAVGLVVLLGLFDALQRKDPIHRVYPVVGRLPAMLRKLRDVLRLGHRPELPFDDIQISRIRTAALTGTDITSFGTRLTTSYSSTPVSLFPSPNPAIHEISVGHASRPTVLPILNFGAIGYGPVNENVLKAIALASENVQCMYNSGEDGLIHVHREHHDNLIWQIGTGYWGCRTDSGQFSFNELNRQLARTPVAMIEIKLGQGAKPGAGGLMPAKKNTRHVASHLGVPPGIDIVSGRTHSAFSSSGDLCDFIKTLRDGTDGRPIGLKVAVGINSGLPDLIDEMQARDALVDYLVVDGADGGTGAGSTVLQDHAGLPALAAVKLTRGLLSRFDLLSRVRLFGSGRVSTGYDLLRMLKAGADAVFFTRAPLIAIGCVQARDCHVGTCPSGIATHTAWRRRAVSPTTQSTQLSNYHRSVMRGVEDLVAASGTTNLKEFLLAWEPGGVDTEILATQWKFRGEANG